MQYMQNHNHHHHHFYHYHYRKNHLPKDYRHLFNYIIHHSKLKSNHHLKILFNFIIICITGINFYFSIDIPHLAFSIPPLPYSLARAD